jgi:HPt (histidine-containing phosphotransfer) domain-containing protein
LRALSHNASVRCTVTNDPPIVDWQEIAGLREIQTPGESDIVTELIDLFVADSSAGLEQAHRACERNDRDTIVRVAHRLRGSAGMLGARRLHALAQDLELRLRNGAPADLPQVCAQLTAAVDEVKTAFANRPIL